VRYVRAVIADALKTAPTQAEIDREVSEMRVGYTAFSEQRTLQASSALGDEIVRALDIREAVADPAAIPTIFDGARPQFTPANVPAHTRSQFQGAVTPGVLTTPPLGEACAAPFPPPLPPILAFSASLLVSVQPGRVRQGARPPQEQDLAAGRGAAARQAPAREPDVWCEPVDACDRDVVARHRALTEEDDGRRPRQAEGAELRTHGRIECAIRLGRSDRDAEPHRRVGPSPAGTGGADASRGCRADRRAAQ